MARKVIKEYRNVASMGRDPSMQGLVYSAKDPDLHGGITTGSHSSASSRGRKVLPESVGLQRPSVYIE